MKLTELSSMQVKVGIIIALLALNAIVWGRKATEIFPEGKIYASGTAFANDGTVLNYVDALQFKDEYFSFSLKVNWKDKSNTMQEAGLATRSFLGAYDVTLTTINSFGESVLDNVDLDEDMMFNRGYMQGGNAKVKLLPIADDFDGVCYYLMYLNRVYCGAARRNTP